MTRDSQVSVIKSIAATLLLWFALEASLGQAQTNKYGQFAPPDAFENGSSLAYYGSENEWSRRQFTAERADALYNRRGQRQLLLILDGRPNDAIKTCRKYLEADPNDLESLFTMAVAHSQLGNADAALATMQQALTAGLPFERFVAGPRDLLSPLTSTTAFQDYLADHPVRLLHGPMLGAVTDTAARVWLRTADEGTVELSIFAAVQGSAPIQTAVGRSLRHDDYTAVLKVTGLQPDTRYSYDVSVDGKSCTPHPRPTFHTFPKTGSAARFRVAFGGGAGYTPHHERMWDTILSFGPAAMLLLGDNVYIDLPDQPGPLHRYTYYRRQSRPEFRRLVGSVPTFAIWDDHDAAIDDVWLGPYPDRPSWKPAMLSLFKQNWVNPAYGNRQWPGCWFKMAIADVDFFMLDCRYYRTNPFADQRTMLGPAQKAWLLRELKASRATFKIVASSVAWAPGAKPGSRDTWDGFAQEREEIFSWLEQNRIEGVVLLSADRHRSEAWKIERPHGYPLYDLLSSRLTNIHTHDLVEGALFSYNDKCSIGLLNVDTTGEDPELTYRIINIDGQEIHSLPLRRSQLTFTAAVNQASND